MEKDQVLFYLEDEESEELKAAEKALDDALLAYEQAILSGEISNQVINNAQNGNVNSIAGYQARINAANKTESDAQATVDSLQEQINEIDRQLSLLGYVNVDTTAETAAVVNAENNLNSAKTELENAQAKLSTLQAELDSANKVIFNYDNGITVSGGNQEVEDRNVAEYQSAKATVKALPSQITSAQSNVNSWHAKGDRGENKYAAVGCLYEGDECEAVRDFLSETI